MICVTALTVIGPGPMSCAKSADVPLESRAFWMDLDLKSFQIDYITNLQRLKNLIKINLWAGARVPT